jgi:hypothetical protein
MATLELREGMAIAPAIVRRLTKEAFRLNETLGDPTRAAKQPSKRADKARSKRPGSKKRAV